MLTKRRFSLKDCIVIIVTLCLTTTIVAVVHDQLSPLIKLNEQLAKKQSEYTSKVEPNLLKLIPGSDSYKQLGIWNHLGSERGYYLIKKGSKVTGHVIGSGGKGYSSTIEVLIGIDLTGKITAIKIIGQNETEGLGTKILEKEFLDQFTGTKITNYKDTLSINQRIQSITAATVSSHAVIYGAIRPALDFLHRSKLLHD